MDASSETPTPTELPRLINITQVADHLGVNVRHVRRLVYERRIPFLKWGHLIRFDPAKVQRWMEENSIDLPPTRPGRPPVVGRR